MLLCVDDETLGHMFKPFYSTKSEGLGMGLTICATIIDAHGGRIAAAPGPEGGLSVQFTVPAVSAEAAS